MASGDQIPETKREKKISISDQTLVKFMRSGDIEQLEKVLNADNVNDLYEEHAIIGRLCFTPLSFAILYGNRDIVGLCIKLGADVEKGSYLFADHKFQKRSPLYMACEARRPDIIEDLVNAGADVNASSGSPLTRVFDDDIQTEMLSELVSGQQGIIRLDVAPTCLEEVCINGIKANVPETLLRCGAVTGSALRHAVEKDSDWSTPLLIAQETNVSADVFSSVLPSFFDTYFDNDIEAQRQILETLIQTVDFDFPTIFGKKDLIIKRFCTEVFDNRPEGSEWKDGVFDSHLGAEMFPEIPEISSDDSDDSDPGSNPEGEDITVACSECTEDKLMELCRYSKTVGENLDIKLIRLTNLCWMRHVMLSRHTPSSLQAICRKAIRSAIGGVKMADKVGSFGLPKRLQKYVLFKPLSVNDRLE